ncbi:MAG: hypothetical protein U9N49_06370, partial [Campylobacterota bacterium]|nr:hypothetical protein [Campylobacterota bacterium]
LTQIESMNLQDYNITFPKVTANGDSVKISYKFNGNIVAEGSSIILNGSQNNLLEVLVQEQGGDQEEQNLSKTIQLVDTIAPLPPFIDHPLSTALTQVDVLVTAFEDNVDLYLNGTLIDTIVDSTQSQSVTLNTNITAGLLNFDFTLKDAQGNESNLTTIEIQKINPNSPTDFSDVVIQNINVDGSLTGAKLSGNIVDADGISQVVITYQGDPNQDIFASGNINGAREKTFGTNYTIEVTDGKGVISTKSGTITEQNEPMQLLSVSLFDNKIMMLEVKDLNRIQSVSISYPSGESSLGSPYDGFGSTTFYSSTLSEPILSYPFTYTITVRDLLGNDESYTRTVIAPVESDFTNVVIGNNLTNTPPDASGYLAGSIKDPNGIKDIYISYGDGSNDTLAGNGATEVFLSALSPHDHNTTFNISVTDMDGGFSSTSGVIAP